MRLIFSETEYLFMCTAYSATLVLRQFVRKHNERSSCEGIERNLHISGRIH